MRGYKSGMTWCAWRWTTAVRYLTRLHLARAPWGAIMLHWINEPDPQPDPHDHPVDFVSITLRGGYTEEVYSPTREFLRLRRRRVRVIRASHVHRIVDVDPGTLTLAFAGPVRRAWCFYVEAPWGVERVPWREYDQRANER